MTHPPRHPAPRQHPLALCRRHQRPAHACARSRLRDQGPALRPAAARLSRARLLLAQGDAGAGCGRLSRDRAGPARLWPHHRMGSRITTAISPRSGSPIWCATRSGWCRRSATQVDAVVGHDFGSPVAAWCALIRPDVFRSVSLMSAPFGGAAVAAVQHRRRAGKAAAEDPVHRELAALPRPRKHYQWYYSTREANADMHHAPQGVHDFLRAYYHHKSADWKDNKPYPLKSWSAGELAKLPTYYVMDLAKRHGRDGRGGNALGRRDRRQQMAARQRARLLQRRICAAPDSRAACNGIAAAPRARSRRNCRPGRAAPSTCPPPSSRASRTGAPISAPACSRRCSRSACTNMIGCHLVDGAGHWVQQEQPAEVSRLLLHSCAKRERRRLIIDPATDRAPIQFRMILNYEKGAVP